MPLYHVWLYLLDYRLYLHNRILFHYFFLFHLFYFLQISHFFLRPLSNLIPALNHTIKIYLLFQLQFASLQILKLF
ncbi:unnamed protein product [Meloidogyne enterolobii]|uniref:Uncharacterized protein n=1 Tax=Meloidogyne enterolobii TaxID=390850 RepID=A0ACB1B7V9_MELEN